MPDKNVRVSKINGGGRKITHPSGHEDIETPKMQADELARMDEAVDEAKRQRDQYAEEIK